MKFNTLQFLIVMLALPIALTPTPKPFPVIVKPRQSNTMFDALMMNAVPLVVMFEVKLLDSITVAGNVLFALYDVNCVTLKVKLRPCTRMFVHVLVVHSSNAPSSFVSTRSFDGLMNVLLARNISAEVLSTLAFVEFTNTLLLEILMFDWLSLIAPLITSVFGYLIEPKFVSNVVLVKFVEAPALKNTHSLAPIIRKLLNLEPFKFSIANTFPVVAGILSVIVSNWLFCPSTVPSNAFWVSVVIVALMLLNELFLMLLARLISPPDGAVCVMFEKELFRLAGLADPENVAIKLAPVKLKFSLFIVLSNDTVENEYPIGAPL